MKAFFTLVFFSLILSNGLTAQKNKVAIHLNSPMGMFQKVVLKVEYRPNQMGVLLTGTQFYGSLPKYPGS